MMQLEVQAAEDVAEGVRKIELADRSGTPLPPFTAGAHIELSLGNGLTRSYSLVNGPSDASRYVVAVAKDPRSRGGSIFIHNALQAGDTVKVGLPRNNFPLVEAATHSVFIAGGIGITPIRCMMRRLDEIGAPWEALYCARSRQRAAFVDEIAALPAFDEGRVQFHFDDENGGPPELGRMFLGRPEGTHFYGCGPEPMLKSYEAAGAAAPPRYVHLERFAGIGAIATGGGFEVVLAKSKRTINIEAGETVLDALLQQGLDVDFSCMEGICGSCRVRVLEGELDHRDSFLNSAQKAAGDAMMICCSGSKGARLVLDL
jgi:tetrachlorobenzoquinone reductase